MKLCIDPGHGLSATTPRRVYDPGAVSGHYEEATIVLQYAQALAAECEALGVPTWLTRRNDEDLMPLLRRVPAAREQGCDMLVSLHCNAATSRDAHGTETLYRTSKSFASALQSAAVGAIQLRDRGLVARPNLAVLKFPGPCALIELGFITNEDDLSVVLRMETMRRFAKAIAETIHDRGWM